MFTSSADVFRTRQAVADLLEVVRLHRKSVPRIGVSGAEMMNLDAIIDRGGLIPAARRKTYSSILLAAAMPDDDFNGFAAATALLLADRLQSGGGEDDLYWNYDAFRDHYLIADAPVRAALMNGFRILQLSGRGTLPEPPDAMMCFTRQEDDVLLILRSEGADALADIILTEPEPNEAGALWDTQRSHNVPLSVKVGFRYLFERPGSIAPGKPGTAKLIPWG
ncbi:MAG: hypothetical protein AAFY31_03595 [Pseudomonadota bacterium]